MECKKYTLKDILRAVVLGAAVIALAVTLIKKSTQPKNETLVVLETLVKEHSDSLSTDLIDLALRESLQTREAALKKEISIKTDIALEDWNTRKKEYIVSLHQCGDRDAATAQKEQYVLLAETKKVVTGILNQMGIDSKKIHLLKREDNPSNPASSVSNVLFINEQLFTGRPVLEQKQIIGHEGTHLIFQDTADKHAIKSLITDKYGTISQEHRLLLEQLSRFFEERADVVSLLYGKEYRDGSLASLEYFNNLYGSRTPPTHPTYRERIDLAQAIVTTFNNCTAT